MCQQYASKHAYSKRGNLDYMLTHCLKKGGGEGLILFAGRHTVDRAVRERDPRVRYVHSIQNRASTTLRA